MLKGILLSLAFFGVFNPSCAMQKEMPENVRTFRYKEIRYKEALEKIRKPFAKSFAQDYAIYMEKLLERSVNKCDLTETEKKFIFYSNYAYCIDPYYRVNDRQLETLLKKVFNEEIKDFNKEKVSFYSVVDENGNLCGYFSTEKLKGNDLYIRQFFVTNAFKGQGVGTHIATKILPKLAKDNPLYVATRYINEGALALWENSGFTETQEYSLNEKEWIHGLPKHSYVMLKKA